ncbi:hypothetical protein [Thiothrix unzii]|uniref:Uncharacterized protein n=1 Tax=Thiothrix unzii TaxID=111769 RepID=A0A975F8B3_9GAMM|nr:hypothetical protein [Thiothrix unzii]QTR53127.1 hypothetical protein J9260_15680 [Thiothrix unzii]
MITNTLPFEQRLKMAQAVIDAHLQRAKPAHRQILLNSMWARWINRTVFNHKPTLREVKP